MPLMLFYTVLAFWIPFFGSSKESPKHSIGPPPAWVKPCNFEKNPAIKPSQNHTQMLLIEDQELWEEKAFYYRRVFKILNEAGAQNFHRIKITFNPSFQRVVMHTLRLERKGEVYDLLSHSTPEVINQEPDIDKNFYHGSQTLVYFLGDVHIGDIIEFSYSCFGRQSFSNKIFDIIPVQERSSIEKIYYRLLADPKRLVQTKSFHTSLEPQVVDLNPHLREWTWEALETPPYLEESDTPDWYHPYARIQVTDFQSWKELAEVTSALYKLPFDFAPSEEMLHYIQHWKDQARDPLQRALLSVRFVQDEVKYLGFGEGTKGFKPDDPRDTLARRFGDCKNKSLLLKTLLNLMEIEADIVLVNQQRGKILPEMLPAPNLFNHVVIRIFIDGVYYYVDPTLSQQKGSLKNNFFPDYYSGLVISPDTTELTMLPRAVLQHPREIHTMIRLSSPTQADLTIRETRYGQEANYMRQDIARVSSEVYFKDSLKEVQRQYKGATEVNPIQVIDDVENNVLIIEKHYQISTRARPGKRFLKVDSAIHRNILENDIDLDRSAPYKLSYPKWVKEHIHIENPFTEWELEEEAFENTLQSAEYAYHMKREGHAADFTYELHHLDDHISISENEKYWHFVNEVESHSSQELYIAPAGLPPARP